MGKMLCLEESLADEKSQGGGKARVGKHHIWVIFTFWGSERIDHAYVARQMQFGKVNFGNIFLGSNPNLRAWTGGEA